MEETKNEVAQEMMEVQEEAYKSGSVQYIESREVAKMVEKDHDKLCRDIRRYASQLDAANFGDISAFWMESTYVDTYGRTQKCYLVTKKGCEFIAHKLTGEKGSVFTATYINRFHEIEDKLTDNAGISAELVNTLVEFVKQQAETNRVQAEFNRIVMERLEKLEGRKAGYKANPYQAIEENIIESRKKELYRLTAKVAELCRSSYTRILHQMYRTLEDRLGIVLDSYKSAYHSETGWQDAGMVEVIAANDWLYEKAVDMNKFVIERKQIYG